MSVAVLSPLHQATKPAGGGVQLSVSTAPISTAALEFRGNPRWSKAELTAAPSLWLNAVVLLAPRVTVRVLLDLFVTSICSLSIWIVSKGDMALASKTIMLVSMSSIAPFSVVQLVPASITVLVGKGRYVCVGPP